jgi:alginate O-acetyltransferase complex protein AlgI
MTGPMLFSSVGFIFLFLPIVLAGFYGLVHTRQIEAAKYWLIAASIVFYGNFIPVHLALLALSTVVNFAAGRVLLVKRSKTILTLGIVFNIAVLALFKYADFAVANLNALFDLKLPMLGLILPLALSFFTFQKLAYLIDVYRGGAPRYGFRDFVLFVVFFPQLIAGPIVHHREIMPQIAQLGRRRDIKMDLAVGLTAFVIGLFKKRGIADSLAVYSDTIFGAAEHGASLDFLTAWIGVTAFALQIYFDFSGYSDMALGLGRMFGIKLPVNFLSPYKSTSIIEFWRRWHISLSRFLRDYLYVPLGGNRHGPFRRYLNLWIVMLLGGLWHGANWTFVVWGGLHGLYLSINHAIRSLKLKPRRGGTLACWAVTMMAVLVAWVFFRAQSFSSASAMLQAMAGWNGIILPSGAAALEGMAPNLVAGLNISFGGLVYLLSAPTSNLIWLPVGVLICLATPNVADWLARWELAINDEAPRSARAGALPWRPSLGWGAAMAIVFALCVLYQQSNVQFLYFQF